LAKSPGNVALTVEAECAALARVLAYICNVQLAKLASWLGSERRKKRYELLPCPDRRGATAPNGGHPVPVPGEEDERVAIEQSSRAYRLPHFMKQRSGRATRRS
jgi:hypothetical protein